MPTEKPRITITMTEDEFKRVEAYRFETRQKNQTQAILSLVRLGLEDYIETSPDLEGPRDEKETLFMDLFGRLTDDHKRFLIAVMKVLLEQGR